jgi:hypothetical protein
MPLISAVNFHWHDMFPLVNLINFAEAINQDVESLSRYVEIDARNFSAFSIENARILLACCAEIESILRQMALISGLKSRASNIDTYLPAILKLAPDFLDRKISSPRLQLALQPWLGWVIPPQKQRSQK